MHVQTIKRRAKIKQQALGTGLKNNCCAVHPSEKSLSLLVTVLVLELVGYIRGICHMLFFSLKHFARYRFSLTHSLRLRGYVFIAYWTYYILYLRYYPGKRWPIPKLHQLRTQSSLTQHRRMGLCSQVPFRYCVDNKIWEKKKKKKREIKVQA